MDLLVRDLSSHLDCLGDFLGGAFLDPDLECLQLRVEGVLVFIVSNLKLNVTTGKRTRKGDLYFAEE